MQIKIDRLHYSVIQCSNILREQTVSSQVPNFETIHYV
jgi:hypothetical protein